MTWPSRRWFIEAFSLAFSFAVLATGAFYTFVNVLIVPRPGFTLTSNWVVSTVDTCPPSDPRCALSRVLQPGDQIVRIGALTYDRYRSDYSASPFAGFAANDVVMLEVLRGDRELEIPWRMPVFSATDYWLSATPLVVFLPFWLAGTFVLLFLRPRGRLWATLIASNYLFGLWALTGTNAGYQLLGMTHLYIAVSWMLVPTYLHLHLEALNYAWARRRALVAGLYLAGGLFGALTLNHLISARWCSFVVGTAVLVSLVMLGIRWRSGRPQTRQTARLMLFSVSLAFGPGLLVLAVTAVTDSPASSNLVTAVSLVALAIWPIGYVYAAFRNFLGALEFRANRLITQYSFAIIVSTLVAIATLLSAERTLRAPEVFTTVVLVTVAVMALVGLYGPFQRWMNRQAYGMVHTPEDILKVMARQLPVVSDEPELIRLLADELLPSLLVRQSALYRLRPEAADLVYQRHVDAAFTLEQLQSLANRPWVYLPPDPAGNWVRLVVPLEVQQRRLGLWLFGRRDPDDFYSAQDITLLRLLANQVAVALENSRLYKTVQQQAAEMAQLYEAEKEVSRLKSEFLARTSHELRTPLTGILGSLGLVLDDSHTTPEERRKFIETAHRSASTLMRLVNDLLDMAQIEAGRLTTHLWAMDLRLLLLEVYAEFEAQARLKGLRLELDDGGSGLLAWADPDRARQILRNLVDNALKFTAEGRVRITARPDLAAGVVRVSVEDNGIGVPPEKQSALFQPFTQVDGSEKRRYGGSGLGLAISRRLAELMGGTVTLHSEGEGRGCTVTLTLRLASSADEAGFDAQPAASSAPLS